MLLALQTSSCSIRSGMTSYPATIFRFPLRQPNAKSEISSNSYSVDRVRDFLFQSFIEEAPIILLFLKHVEEITLYDGNEQLYKVCIHPSQKRTLQCERGALIRLGLSNSSYPTLRLYSMSLGVDNYCSGEKESYSYHWLVCNMIGSSIHEVQDMSRKLQILPWVGVAVPLPEKLDISEVQLSHFNIGRIADMLKTLQGKVRRNVISLPWCDGVQGHTEGRAFCFLPLPNHTCLPVNIHGYFGVSDNRRSIEWPASDNRSDKAVWNRELILKHVAPLYSVLICCRSKLISYTDTLLPAIGKGNMTDPYAAWPLSSEVKHKEIWSELVKPTVSGCLDSNNPIFWSPIGRWVSLHEAVFLPRKPDFPLPTIAIEILINAGIPIVNLPDKVWQTLEECQLKHQTENVVTPSHVRIAMRNTRHLFHSFEELQALLECIFHDINRQNSMELDGLGIIPLATEHFKVKTLMASSNEHDVIYLLEKRMICVVDFLPGVECSLISKSLVNISNIYNMFYNLAKWKTFQIRLLDPKILCLKLLPLSIKSWTTFKLHTPIVWKPQKTGNPPIKWIEDLWNWLCSNPEVLGDTVGLPILPKEVVEDDGSSYTLLPFPSSNDKYYFKDDDEEEGIASLLTKLGATVLEKNKFVFCHRRISHHVLRASIPQALPYFSKRVPLVNGLSRSDREYLCSCIAQCYYIKKIPSEYVQMLRMLSIYKVGVGGTSKNIASLENYNLILPPCNMMFEQSLKYPSDFLDNTDRDVFHLLSYSLRQHVCNPDEVYLATLQFAITQCSGSSSWNNGDKLIMWVINENPNPSQQLIDYLSHQAFVRTEANSKCLKKPCELYNPCDEQFFKLFNRNKDEVFPKCDYLENNGLSVLIRLGLKSWANLSYNPQALGEFLRERAESVSRLSNDEAFERSCYILELIGMFHRYSNELICFVKSVKFLIVEVSPPERFLSLLFWYGKKYKNKLESPNNLFYDLADANLVGSIRPFICSEYRKAMNVQLPHTVIENFLTPSIGDVLQQLSVLTEAVKKNGDFDENQIFTMVDKIYSYLNLHAHLLSPSSLPKNWIWWRDQRKFLPSDIFVLATPFDLTPFIYSIESKSWLLRHQNLFQRSGIKHSPNALDLVSVLHELSESLHTPLKEDFIKLSVLILDFLHQNKYDSTGDIFLPTVDLKLCPVKECTYDDREWVRKKVGSGLRNISFVHERVPANLARYFGVEPLSRKVAQSTRLPIKYKQLGQKESLTHRIRGIVNDYSGNIDVFKELIQNADDAKATEIILLMDWRQHGQESLFEEDMKYWQGPALVAYNNATFSDQDFNNICELAGETKMSDPLKTGRFGVGFCSCYSLTDVPSFISRHLLTIFDPHTIYLKDRISHNEPGMQIDIVEEKQGIRIFEDQFAPFDGLFGCNLLDMEDSGFNGTIFRFPLRMKGAPPSEITNDKYNHVHIMELIEKLQNEARKLLLFLKHVQRFKFFELKRNAKSPEEMKLLFKVVKKGMDNSQRVDIIRNYITNPSIDHAPICSSCTISVDIPSAVKSVPDKHYIIASAIGIGSNHTIKGVIPLAELAVERTKEGFPVPHDDGQLFCFLPLPVKHSLPFHINGYFDVGKDRRGLREAHDSPEYMWNKRLIEKVLPIAFEFFLHTLTTLVNLSSQDNSYKKQFLKGYYALWPGNTTDKGWVCELFSTTVKDLLTRSEKCLLWSDVNEGEWVSLANACFFKRVSSESISSDVLQDAVKMLISNSIKVVECPLHVFKMCCNTVEKNGNLFNYKRFFTELFITEIDNLEDSDTRDRHLLFVLKKIHEERNVDVSDKLYHWAIDILKKNKCIPIAESSKLAYPCDVIDVHCSPISCLYNVSDGRFPKESFRNPSCTSALTVLGMISKQLPIDKLAERASTVSTINEDEAHERMINILKYITFIERKEGTKTYTFSFSTPYNESRKSRISALSSIKFLMAQPNPSIPFIPWYNLDRTFFSPSELFAPKHMGLIFNQKPIFLPPSLMEEEKTVDSLMMYLGIENQEPSLEDVMRNLCNLIDEVVDKEIVDSSRDFLDDNFTLMYEFLNSKSTFTSNNKEALKSEIGGKPCIWQYGRLHYPHQILFHWDKKTFYPYLCPLSDKNSRFEELFSELGVEKEASSEFLCTVLSKINKDHLNEPLSDEILEFVCDITTKLHQKKHTLNKQSQNVFLPDKNKVLCPVDKLCCDSNLEADWISHLTVYQDFQERGGQFVHPRVPRDIALDLGAYPIIDAVLKGIEDETFLNEVPFGQYENIVDRLNGILKKYPADEAIFKEFIQNADDAKANEIVFVLDWRTDYPDQALLSNEKRWKQLQKTPALCIFNNKPFKEEDIKNICKLGRGGKGETADTIGRFGIGFNVAYHLTDCPSFVSFDKNGNPENFCVFDPLKKYCPRANWKMPGRRWKGKDALKQFPDQIQPFLTEQFDEMKSNAPCFHDLTEGFCVFRLPILHFRPNPYLNYTGEHYFKAARINHPREVIKYIGKLKEESDNMILFLNHLKSISVFEIKDHGKVIHHFSTTSKIDSTPKELCTDYGMCSISLELSLLHIVSTEKAKKERKSKWLCHKLIWKQPSQVFDQTVLNAATEIGLEPNGGTALQLGHNNDPLNGFLFYFLPMNISSCLPIHFHTHFLVDDSRCHLDNKFPNLKSWNEDLVENVLVPSYVQLILEARRYVDRSEESVRWFYSLFPNLNNYSLQQSEASTLSINRLFYKALINDNHPILLDNRGINEGEISWLCINEGDTGLFCTSSYRCSPYVIMNETVRQILCSLTMPITCAPNVIFESLCEVSEDYTISKTGLVTPQKVLDYFKSENFSENQKIIIKKNCIELLEFCLQNFKKMQLKSVLAGAPLLLTLANTLDLSGSLFESCHASLLPHCKSKFIDPSLEWSTIGKELKEGGEITYLPVFILSQEIQLSDVDEPVKLDAEERTLVEKLWLYLSHPAYSLFHPDNAVSDYLKHKPIIPTSHGTYYPPCLSKCVFENSRIDPSIFSAVKKLGYPIVDFNIVTVPKSAAVLLSTFTNPQDIISAMQLFPPKYDVTFTADEVSRLLSLLCLSPVLPCQVSEMLKCLPLFETVDGSYLCLSEAKKFYVMPANIPSNGLETIQKATKKLILKVSGHTVEKFYSTVIKEADYSSAKLSDAQFYIKFILPHLEYLNDIELLVHLKVVKNLLSPYNYYSDEEERVKIINLLRAKPFIKKDGKQYLPSELYDPEIKFHNTFNKTKLPPEEWTGEWLPFLRALGLQREVDNGTWLSKAKKVAEEGSKLKTQNPCQDLIDKSESLLVSLKEKMKCNQKNFLETSEISEQFLSFLTSVSKIQFIYCKDMYQLEIELQVITGNLPQKYKSFLLFHEAILSENENLSCLCRTVLPPSCNFLKEIDKVFKDALSIRPLSIKIVIRNLITLSTVLCSAKVQALVPSETKRRAIKMVKKVFEDHYSYLETNYDDNKPALFKELLNERCILLSRNDLSFHLVQPSQLVLVLLSDLELSPFCYQVPQELLKYGKLLRALEVREDIDPLLCLDILFNIKKEMENAKKKLSQDDHFLNVCKSAYNHMIFLLRKQPNTVIPKGKKIVLPSDDYQLHECSELVCNDVPWIQERLQKSDKLRFKFLCPPPPDKKGQRVPPPCLGIKLLSSLAKEELHKDILHRLNRCQQQELHQMKKRERNCEMIEVLSGTFQSKEFTRGFGRLYWHEHQKNPGHDKNFCLRLRKLTEMTIYCVENIKTLIVFNGKEVPGTEDSYLCYLKEEAENMKLYIAHDLDSIQVFLEQLTATLNKYLEHCVKNEIPIKAMLWCRPEEIENTLNKLHISPFNPKQVEKSSDEMDVGSEILFRDFYQPKEDMLIICDFEKDEKVIYHSLDDGKPIYRIGQILKCPLKNGLDIKDRYIELIVGINKDGPKVVKVSLFQVCKMLSTSQYQMLETDESTNFSEPLILAPLSENKDDLCKLITQTIHYNQEHPCCSLCHLCQRFLAHMYHLFIRTKQNETLFLLAANHILEVVKNMKAPHSQSIAANAVKDIIKFVRDLKISSLKNDHVFGNPPGPFKGQDSFPVIASSHAVSSLPDSGSTLFNQPSISLSSNFHHSSTHGSQTQPGQSRFAFVKSSYSTAPSGGYGFVSQPVSYPSPAAIPSIPKINPDLFKAKAWLQQAKADFMAACDVYQKLMKVAEEKKSITEQDNEIKYVSDDKMSENIELEAEAIASACDEESVDEQILYTADASHNLAEEIEVNERNYESNESSLDDIMEIEIDTDKPLSHEEDTEQEEVKEESNEGFKYASLVCFLCHDVVEKCIKGSLYAKCGLPDRLLECNNLITLSNELEIALKSEEKLKKLVQSHASLVAIHGNRSRYPNYHYPTCAPASVYSVNEAQEALKTVNDLMHLLLQDCVIKELLGDLKTLSADDFRTTLSKCMKSDKGRSTSNLAMGYSMGYSFIIRAYCFKI